MATKLYATTQRYRDKYPVIAFVARGDYERFRWDEIQRASVEGIAWFDTDHACRGFFVAETDDVPPNMFQLLVAPQWRAGVTAIVTHYYALPPKESNT